LKSMNVIVVKSDDGKSFYVVLQHTDEHGRKYADYPDETGKLQREYYPEELADSV